MNHKLKNYEIREISQIKVTALTSKYLVHVEILREMEVRSQLLGFIFIAQFLRF